MKSSENEAVLRLKMESKDEKKYFFAAVFVFPVGCIVKILNLLYHIQARIAQLVAYRLGTREIPGSNPSKGKNFSVKISNWIV